MRVSRFSILVVIFTIINVALCAYAAQEAANSSKNQIQIQKNELDARDQGNSEQDVATTRKIRQDVVAEKSFSSAAKNVKIITRSGHVTLKGPVRNVNEKQAIEAIALKVAGRDHVNNELEIE